MKKLLLSLLLIILAVCVCACGSGKEEPESGTGSVAIPHVITSQGSPVQLNYYRRWIYGADYTTDDPEYIDRVVSALNSLRIGEEVDYIVDDYTDIVELVYEDGHTLLYEFEEGNIVLDEGRYACEGVGTVRSLLNELAEGR